MVGLWLVIAVHLVFIAYFWQFEPRFLFPVLPLTIALGCTAAWWAIEWPIAWAGMGILWLVRRLRPDGGPLVWTEYFAVLRHWPAAATLLAAALVFFTSKRVYAFQEHLVDQAGAAIRSTAAPSMNRT